MLFLYCSLRRSQTCDGHAERRATHIVESYAVAELHRRRLATVLAADAALEVGACGAAFLYGHLYELADTVLVKNLERV